MLVFFRPWGRLNARHLYTVVLGCDKTESHAWSQIWTLLRGRLRNTLDEIKKTQKHNAKIGLSFERFQKWWFCKWWYYWKAVANCVEAALEGSRRIIPSCPTGGSQCATYTADWLALLTTKWLSVPGSEKTSMNVLTIRLVLLMYFCLHQNAGAGCPKPDSHLSQVKLPYFEFVRQEKLFLSTF